LIGPLAFDQVRDGVQTERVDAEVEPEAHHVDDRFEHLGVVEIQIWLM
jgi:hypothetical protein